MKSFCRREFLTFSALASAAWVLTACKFPITGTPVNQPQGLAIPQPLAYGALPPDVVEKVERTVAYVMESNKVPGMAIGIVKNGQPVYAKGFGVAQQGESRAVTPQTLFRVMDVTHLFTAGAAAELAAEGKLDLDAPILGVLPYFRLGDERYRQITTRHLLSETAGLPWTPEGTPEKDWIDKTPQYDDEALERYVRSLSDIKLSHDPGTSREFTNISFDIAGDVIAKASGELYEDYMQQHMLTPLGMSQSTFFPQQADPALAASPHIVQGGNVVVSDLTTYSRERAPSVGLLSNVDDLTRWMLADLNWGELNGERVFQASGYDQLWKSTLKLNYASDMTDMGLGWFLGTSKGHPVCQYWGNDVGFHAAVYLAPEQKSGIVVMGNQFTGSGRTNFYCYTVASIVLPMIAFA